MADRVRKVAYCYAKVPSRAAQGVKLLEELDQEGVNLLAFTGFPLGGGKAQLDFVPDNMTALKRVARRNGWKLSKGKKGFLVWGNDRVGAVNRHVRKLADKGINITAADAVTAGKGRYGMLLWVKKKDYAKAARALRAK
jgi:hypothetical protein